MLRGPRVRDAFPVLFLLFTVAGFVLGGSYLWIKIQVWKAGERLSITLDHDTRLFQKYRKIAKARYLPIWPLYLYWASAIAALVIGMGLVAAIHN